tara:strand:- start:2043 stop:2978 length:936 start_codon:yes stop_codon:yes gene_type:complete
MDKNITENNYGSIYKTTGGGNESFKINPHHWVKKILGNRVFDLYIKYLGVKTLTTFTLVPLALIISRDLLESYIKSEQSGQTGGYVVENLPIIDNPVVGNYLKLMGLSMLNMSAYTLLPLGVLMVIYDLTVQSQSGGSINKSLSYKNLTYKNTPLYNMYRNKLLDMKKQNGGGSDWIGSQYSAGPVNNPQMSDYQFRMFNKTNMNDPYFVKNYQQVPDKLILDTPLYKQNQPSSGLSTSQYGGASKLSKKEIYNILDSKSDSRVKIVKSLLSHSNKSDSDKNLLTKLANDKRYNSKKIYKFFNKKDLLNHI